MDKNDFGRFVKRERKQGGRLSQKKVAALIGSDPTTISRIENGKRNLSLDFILKLANAIRVEPHRFFSDEPLVPKRIVDRQPIIIESFPDRNTQEEFHDLESAEEFIPVRILADAASLGQGRIISSEETKGYALIYKHALNRKAWTQKRNAEKIICVWAEGDSMLPTIQNGSLAAIDVEDRSEIRNQKIYAVELPDEGVVLKRLHRTGDHLILFADNQNTPDYPKCMKLDEEFSPIRGRVVWTWNVLE